jgi:hypothetical protein
MAHIRQKIMEYLEGKINELEIKSKNKNIVDFYSGINGLSGGYRP